MLRKTKNYIKPLSKILSAVFKKKVVIVTFHTKCKFFFFFFEKSYEV